MLPAAAIAIAILLPAFGPSLAPPGCPAPGRRCPERGQGGGRLRGRDRATRHQLRRESCLVRRQHRRQPGPDPALRDRWRRRILARVLHLLGRPSDGDRITPRRRPSPGILDPQGDRRAVPRQYRSQRRPARWPGGSGQGPAMGGPLRDRHQRAAIAARPCVPVPLPSRQRSLDAAQRADGPLSAAVWVDAGGDHPPRDERCPRPRLPRARPPDARVVRTRCSNPATCIRSRNSCAEWSGACGRVSLGEAGSGRDSRQQSPPAATPRPIARAASSGSSACCSSRTTRWAGSPSRSWPFASTGHGRWTSYTRPPHRTPPTSRGHAEALIGRPWVAEFRDPWLRSPIALAMAGPLPGFTGGSRRRSSDGSCTRRTGSCS